MLDERKVDWEAGYAMQDKKRMFLLYVVSEGLCRHINDFSTHFEGSLEEEVQRLVEEGFLEDCNGRLDVTERGRFVLGDLADAMVTRGSWVFSSNPRHAQHGIGLVQEIHGEQAKVEFRPTIFSAPPYLTESRILSVTELRVIKSPLKRLRDGDFEESWRFDLRTRAAQLLVCNRNGQLGDARTDLLPHQISVAHKVVSSTRRRYLIADEVGLGKTIETGMILYALRQRGQAQRVLIVPPAGLTLQWQEEMEEKFDLKFAVYREDVRGPLAFDQVDYLIASVDTLKLDRPPKGRRHDGNKTMVLGAQDWDVIVFDEAHRLSAKRWSAKKTEKTLGYRLAEDLQDRCRALILLTATPHQGDESKFQHLIRLLHSDVAFEELATGSQGNGSMPFTDLILRNRKSKVTDAEGNPIFKGMDPYSVPVPLLSNGEEQFHRELEAYLREGYGFADKDPSDKHRKAIGFVMTTFQKLAASSTRAIKAALEKRLEKLRLTAEETDEEEAKYDARHQGEYEAREAGKDRQMFVGKEVEMLYKLLKMNVPRDAKQGELYKVIESVSSEEPNQPILIFTEYLATQDFVTKLLQEYYGEGCTAIIRGGMSMREKKNSIAAFRDDPKVRFLVSTEAGGEGINLQFAHMMINYDLPWNPFRLAQRYGRLYRYGQKKRVLVFNFQNKGTIEDKVRDYLEQKTKAAAEQLSRVTGETPTEIEEGLLGLFEEHLDYEKIYRDALTRGNIKPSQKEIDKAIKKAEKSYRIAYNSLFSKDIAPFNPDRFAHEVESPLKLEDLKTCVLEFVKREGRKVTESDDGTFEFLLPDCLNGVTGLKQRYHKVTFDRAVAIRNSDVEFMAIGHPFTDAVLRYCGSAGFGGFATSKAVRRSPNVSDRGTLFNFTVKLSKETLEGENVFFEFIPVFVHDDGTIVSGEPKETRQAIVASLIEAKPPSVQKDLHVENAEALFRKAKDAVLEECAQHQPWDEDVFCLSALRVEVL